MTITRLNPDTMYKNPAFTQVAIVENASRHIYVGGQNGVNKDGKMAQGLAAQTEQTFRNVIAALEAGGATMDDVFKMTIYIVQGQSIQDGFAAAQKFDALESAPPTISVIIVAGLANPEALVEIEAVAALS
jgi:enamine deaminase RidA (YjgF/YER057c/UK114 family)